jgi:hypothetical protein
MNRQQNLQQTLASWRAYTLRRFRLRAHRFAIPPTNMRRLHSVSHRRILLAPDLNLGQARVIIPLLRSN